MVDPVLLLTTVAPVLGVVTAIMLFFSPLAAARQALKDGTLGVRQQSKRVRQSCCRRIAIVETAPASYAQDLNAIPFPLVAANCGGWVSYAIVTKDPYVFCANAPGATACPAPGQLILSSHSTFADACIAYH